MNSSNHNNIPRDRWDRLEIALKQDVDIDVVETDNKITLNFVVSETSYSYILDIENHDGFNIMRLNIMPIDEEHPHVKIIGLLKKWLFDNIVRLKISGIYIIDTGAVYQRYAHMLRIIGKSKHFLFYEDERITDTGDFFIMTMNQEAIHHVNDIIQPSWRLRNV